MAKELITQVRQVHGRLKEVGKDITGYQNLKNRDIPQWAEWEYYRLVDLITTATLVAHKLEEILDEHIQQGE